MKIAKINDVEEGKGKVVSMGGKEIALFKLNGQVYVIENKCSHRGGPLGEGQVQDKIVTCPWHGWQFDVTNGQNLMAPGMNLKSYKVEVKGEDVVIDLEE
ncbi:Rieske (2Fe-2S) protein [Candidatus Woesearchaeota archaeon]|nr:Rieske (2Fe-2S) protein [Candidatus Woesearchaeota archaeon]